MSTSGSRPDPAARAPREALEALLDGAAGDPVRRALWLDAVDQRLRVCLPQPLAAHARLANVDRDRLVFIVDTPAWHARLRMLGPQLLDAARSLGLVVTTLVVRTGQQAIQPAVQPERPARQRVTPMSEATRRSLDSALASLAQPPEASKDKKPPQR